MRFEDGQGIKELNLFYFKNMNNEDWKSSEERE